MSVQNNKSQHSSHNGGSRLAMHTAASGSDFGSAMALGHVAAVMDRLLFIAEMQGSTLSQIVSTQDMMAAAVTRLEQRPPAASCPHPVNPAGAKMPFREWVQLVGFVVALAAVVAGKMTPQELLSIAGKPFGF